MLTIVLLMTASASEEGIVGHAWGDCSGCHKETSSEAVSVRLDADRASVAGGESVAITLTVQSTDASHVQAGLDVGAEDGRLSPSATLLFREYEITHQFPHDLTDGSIAFEMIWTAPAYAGTFTLSGVGNAVDGRSTTDGDAWARDTLMLEVTGDCSDADGDRVGDCEGDCDDMDAAVFPGAEEVWYDGVDSDCDGNDDDADGDGIPVSSDCDDSDAAIGACPEDSGAPLDSASPDSGAPAAAQSCGCATSSAGLQPVLLGLLGLLSLRRRRDTDSAPGSGPATAR